MRLLSFGTALNDGKIKLQKKTFYSTIKWIKWCQSVPRCTHEQRSKFEDLPTLIILLYFKNTVDENNIGDLARESVQEYENNVRQMRYNNHLC